MHSPPGHQTLWLCAVLCSLALAGSDPQPGPGRPACPAPCHCQEDGIMLSADCSELGLSVVPGDLDPLTAYLCVGTWRVQKRVSDPLKLEL
ncbi:leucine-rich repeat-containing G-protein coupled receptor 6 precursor [Cricetulus griseus]|nr:leucine-rich repeat-containing G-protein coupled receptor 6 precursor [Cricetulus griseus]